MSEQQVGPITWGPYRQVWEAACEDLQKQITELKGTIEDMEHRLYVAESEIDRLKNNP